MFQHLICARKYGTTSSTLTQAIDGYADGSDKDHLSVVITDCGDPVEKIGEYKSHRDWETKDALVETAKAWLTEHYPDWESPVAYWD